MVLLRRFIPKAESTKVMLDKKEIMLAAFKYAEKNPWANEDCQDSYIDGIYWAIAEILPIVRQSLDQAYKMRGEYLSQDKYAKIASPLLDLLKLEDLIPKQKGGEE